MHRMLLELSEKLETERLLLRPYQAGDGKMYFNLLQNNKEHLDAFVPELKNLHTEEEAEIWIRQRVADWVARKRFVLGIWEKATGFSVGQIWIEPKNWNVPLMEIGWFVAQDHQGKGMISEAAKASLQFIFEDLKAHKALASVRDTNYKSYKLAEKLGFIKEGWSRERGITQDGTRYGTFWYGMLRSEYDELKKNWQNPKKVKSEMKIEFVPITRENWEDALKLEVHPHQQTFAPSVGESLSAAYVKPWDEALDPYLIYIDDVMVGLFYISYTPQSEGNYWLGGFIIDKKYQGMGYGKAALLQILQFIPKIHPNCKMVKLTVEKDNIVAQSLYKSLGFDDTGEVNGYDEIIYNLSVG